MTIMGDAHPRERVALGIARYVRRHAAYPQPRQTLYRATAARDRIYFDEAFALAVASRFLVPAQRPGLQPGWVAGPVNPERDPFAEIPPPHCATCACKSSDAPLS